MGVGSITASLCFRDGHDRIHIAGMATILHDDDRFVLGVMRASIFVASMFNVSSFHIAKMLGSLVVKDRVVGRDERYHVVLILSLLGLSIVRWSAAVQEVQSDRIRKTDLVAGIFSNSAVNGPKPIHPLCYGPASPVPSTIGGLEDGNYGRRFYNHPIVVAASKVSKRFDSRLSSVRFVPACAIRCRSPVLSKVLRPMPPLHS